MAALPRDQPEGRESDVKDAFEGPPLHLRHFLAKRPYRRHHWRTVAQWRWGGRPGNFVADWARRLFDFIRGLAQPIEMSRFGKGKERIFLSLPLPGSPFPFKRLAEALFWVRPCIVVLFLRRRRRANIRVRGPVDLQPRILAPRRRRAYFPRHEE